MQEPQLTRADVTQIVGDVVGEIMADALSMINQRFDRLENKLDAAIDWQRDHEIRIRMLERANPSV